ncbi:MAG: metallophosphoesterase [Bacteroidales bacterium]
MKPSLLLLTFLLFLASCNTNQAPAPEEDVNSFSFAFLTDIHLTDERHAPEGFQQAIDTLNQLPVDFVLTGGDLIMDALDQSLGRADTLYQLYKKMASGISVPVHHTVGNHEVYGWHRDEEGIESLPEFGKGLFEKELGPRYHSFDHKGWHFMILDGLSRRDDGHYVGLIDAEQEQWIRDELARTPKETPLVVVSHIPFITVQTQLTRGSLVPNSETLVLSNGTEILRLMAGHNLKLVLQGHLHFLEDLYLNNQVHFITGGAVCGLWWENQPGASPEEGFVRINVKGEEIDWEYVDYGWTPPSAP